MRGRKTKAELTKRLSIGYVRVSTDDQAENGVSLAAQEERLRAYAVATGRELDELVIDAGESAKTMNRPGLRRILAGVRDRSVGCVVILKLDRLTRSVRDLGEILELAARHDVALMSVSESLDTSSAAGRMVVNMLGVVAQWEREATAERTAFALAHKRRQRIVYGPTPFGYRRDGGQLIADPNLIATRDEAKAMLAAGASLRQIGAWLTSRVGGRWHPQTVKAMLGSRMVAEASA
jgi:site-specific DNA recombinase